jgi:peptidoglycan/xylan/chitin deacetylase (PgdA/CDA1 family)
VEAGVSEVLVLCYHAVSSEWPAALAIRPEFLETQARLLARRGYRSTTFSEAVTRSHHRDRVVAFTFDDAYRSVFTHASPILEAYGFQGTVFVPTDWAGRGEPMSWAGIEHWLGGPHER